MVGGGSSIRSGPSVGSVGPLMVVVLGMSLLLLVIGRGAAKVGAGGGCLLVIVG